MRNISLNATRNIHHVIIITQILLLAVHEIDGELWRRKATTMKEKRKKIEYSLASFSIGNRPLGCKKKSEVSTIKKIIKKTTLLNAIEISTA